MTVDDFLVMPLPQRVKHLLAGELEFRAGHDVVNTTEALGALSGIPQPNS
ncbi:MAG: hypothetical protein AAF493_02015 [Pseudomonadota bacterium]